MRRLIGTLAAPALALAALAVPPGAAAQTLDPPGSDRAGKAARVDTPPPDPTPAVAPRPRAAGAPVTAVAPARVAPPVIGTQQIDRYDAIKKEQDAVAANPKSLDDWIILGELAHEVAMDAPADQAGVYFRMSRDAFEKALALDPSNRGLKAAVQFARDQEGQVDVFEKSRDAVTDTFLDARRRDLAATGHVPAVRVVAGTPPLPSRELPAAVPADGVARTNANPPPATPAAAAVRAATDAKTDPAVNATEPLNAGRGTPVPVAEAAPAVTPARERAPVTDAANYGTQQNYSAATSAAPTVYAGPVVYQPFVTPDGPPYTYQQYSSAYFPTGLYDNPAVPPVTAQRYVPAVTRVVPNVFERQILNRAVTPVPR